MARIMYIHQSGDIGGAGVSLSKVTDMLAEEHDVTVYCPSFPRKLSTFLRSRRIRVVTYDSSIGSIRCHSGSRLFDIRTLHSLLKIPRSRRFWRDVIEKENPDIVIVNSMILSWMGTLVRESGRKSVCFVRETFKPWSSLDPLSRFVKERLNDSFDGVFFISENDKELLECRAPVVQVIRNTVCMEDYAKQDNESLHNEFGLRGSEFVVLFVGGISRLKGTHIALRAFAGLDDLNECRLIIAGSDAPPKRQSSLLLKNRHELFLRWVNYFIESRSLQNRVLFAGVRTDIEKFYSSADVLIFPSTRPHQARPVFEAGAARLPVIISDFPQTSEYVKHGHNGLLFKPNDYKDLADKIKIIYDKRELREELGNNNYEMSIKNHSFGKVKPILLDAIDKVLSL